MTVSKKIAIIGCAISMPISDDSMSLEEIIYDVAQTALRDAGLSIAEVDGIVVASNDQMDGRAISIMAASGSVGGVDHDILSTPSAAEHALVLGALRIGSGHYRTQLIVSWSPTEACAIHEVERLGADPYFHRRLPLDEWSSYALQASALCGKVPQARAAAAALVGNVPSTACDPKRWPLTEGMVSKPRAGAVAIALASEQFVDEHPELRVAWIRGMGWATEPGFLGDRDLAAAPALVVAANRAYAQAEIASPREAFDLAEVSDPTPYQELIALEGLGLSSREAWKADIDSGRFTAEGALPLNPSGGARATNAVFCNGLSRIAAAANQVRRAAGDRQIKTAKLAVAHAASGFAMQYQTVVVLGVGSE